MSIEMVTAMDSDMAVINEDGSKNYVDNPDTTDGTIVIDGTVVEDKTIEPKQETIEDLGDF